jgi:hypothetical protein
MSGKIKILCFTDNASGRDVEMLLPIRYFAERFLDCEFYHALNIDIHRIYLVKPDLILQANTVGSNLYFEISRIAHDQNIPLFALISEGNFRTDGTFDFWGFNRDKIFYQDYVCCWSERTAQFLRKAVPEAADKIVVTGGSGFDRYTIYKFMRKEEFLIKYGREKFKRVIGYAGWAFGKLEYKRGVRELTSFFKGDKNKLLWAEEQRKSIRDILKGAIIANPDILFILKQHPHEPAPERPEPSKNEMSELRNYSNVLYLCDQESIHDLISVSDLWTCFESTTALEAWLMNKQTVFINPDPQFSREPVYTGFAMTYAFHHFQEMIDQYYSTGKIEDFFRPGKEERRKELIKNIIGYGDGMNHLRVSYYLNKTILSLQKRGSAVYKFHFWHALVHYLLKLAGPFYNRKIYSRVYKLKKHLWVFEDYKMDRLYDLYSRYSPFLEKFYAGKHIDRNILTDEGMKTIF